MIVIVTGGRNYKGLGLVAALDEVLAKNPDLRLYVGDARGADALARAWAERRGVHGIKFVAKWAALGNAAGPTRNAKMVSAAVRDRDQDEPVLCIAAPGGRGTADCVRQCRKAGIKVRKTK